LKRKVVSPPLKIALFADLQLYIGSTIKTELPTPNPAVKNGEL
jgi:hypothetical protein